MAVAHKFDDPNPTRRSLLLRLKDWEDQESWKVFFDTYWRLVYSVAIKAGLTDTEADEVVQETFISVAKKIRDGGFIYDRAIGSFKSWLIHTTQFRIGDQYRKRKHQAPAKSPTRTEARTATIYRIPDPNSLNIDRIFDEEWQANLFNVAAERVKHKVSAKQFQIFDLYVLKKWPATKVALTLGINPGAIYIAKHRVTQLIRKEVETLKSSSI